MFKKTIMYMNISQAKQDMLDSTPQGQIHQKTTYITSRKHKGTRDYHLGVVCSKATIGQMNFLYKQSSEEKQFNLLPLVFSD